MLGRIGNTLSFIRQAAPAPSQWSQFKVICVAGLALGGVALTFRCLNRKRAEVAGGEGGSPNTVPPNQVPESPVKKGIVSGEDSEEDEFFGCEEVEEAKEAVLESEEDEFFDCEETVPPNQIPESPVKKGIVSGEDSEDEEDWSTEDMDFMEKMDQCAKDIELHSIPYSQDPFNNIADQLMQEDPAIRQELFTNIKKLAGNFFDKVETPDGWIIKSTASSWKKNFDSELSQWKEGLENLVQFYHKEIENPCNGGYLNFIDLEDKLKETLKETVSDLSNGLSFLFKIANPSENYPLIKIPSGLTEEEFSLPFWLSKLIDSRGGLWGATTGLKLFAPGWIEDEKAKEITEINDNQNLSESEKFAKIAFLNTSIKFKKFLVSLAMDIVWEQRNHPLISIPWEWAQKGLGKPESREQVWNMQTSKIINYLRSSEGQKGELVRLISKIEKIYNELQTMTTPPDSLLLKVTQGLLS